MNSRAQKIKTYADQKVKIRSCEFTADRENYRVHLSDGLTTENQKIFQNSKRIWDKNWDKKDKPSISIDRLSEETVIITTCENGRSGGIRTHDPFTPSKVDWEYHVSHWQVNFTIFH